MADNFHIDVRYEGLDPLKAALRIAFAQWSNGAKSYRIDPSKGLIFYWATEAANETAIEVPFKMDADAAADFASRWLKDTASYAPEPDHDGDNGKGWRVYTDSWGAVSGEDFSICAVQPCWMMYGK